MNTNRSCGECSVCCTGILSHEVYGRKVGNGVDCTFISTSDERCSIYEFRPEQCVGFKCMWLTQLSWPDHMRPDISNILCYTRKKGTMYIDTPKATKQDKQFVETYLKQRNITPKKITYIKQI